MADLNQKRHRVFYGWWIVGACFLVYVYISGAVMYGFTAFFEPIANDFHWSYAQVSFAASLRGMELGLLSPVVGLLVDRWGPRRLMFAGAIISGLGLILLSRTTSLGMYYGAFILIAVGISACIGPPLMAGVANWFRRRVATAMGIVVSGAGFGGLLVPLVVLLIDLFKWRMTMVTIGLGMWVIVLPLSLLLRHKPEQYGYLPDGEEAGAEVVGEHLSTAQTARLDIGAKQAVTSRTFWHIAVTYMYVGLVLMAILTHVMPYLSSIDIARSTASLMAGAIPVVSIAGRLVFGWLGDRIDKKRVTALSCALFGSGVLLFGWAATVGSWLLVPAVILFGVGYGGNVIMMSAMITEYFGRRRFGTIFGFACGVMTVGQIVGPVLAGWAFDEWASYQGVWFVFAAMSLAAIAIVASTPPVRHVNRQGKWDS